MATPGGFDYDAPRAFRDERLAWLDNVARYVAHRGGAVAAAPADAAALADFERETAGGGAVTLRATLPRRGAGAGGLEPVAFVVLDPRLTARAEVARLLVRAARPRDGPPPARVVLVAADPAARAPALAEARAELGAGARAAPGAEAEAETRVAFGAETRVAFEAAAARLFAGPMCDVLFPHRVLPPAEAAELADLGALPVIARDDPGAFWAGAAPGDVVEITAPSDTILEAPEYRVVR